MALYNSEDKYLFFHIFRTGGLSLRRTLDGEEILGGHVVARDVKKWFENKGESWRWEEATKFVMVRNPFDWMLSTYFYVIQMPGHNFHQYMQGKSIAEFLEWYRMKNQEPWVYGGNAHATLTEFITDEDGNQIVDKVLRFEDLPHCVHELRKELGLPEVKMPHINMTKRKKDYRDYYDAKARKLLETIFAEDLERFGYSFE